MEAGEENREATLVTGAGKTAREKLLRIEEELNSEVFEREEVIRSLILALLAGEHVLLLGPPGTAKSQLSEALCGRIEGASYFSTILYRATMPDEVFGPTRLSALREDRYERNTSGMLPEAEVAFIDEVFKASSTLLNGMLSILMEGRYKNGREWKEAPLRIAVAASNEMPEDREELAPFFDRLLVRHTVEPLRSEANIKALLSGERVSGGPSTTVTLDEVEVARAEAGRVDIRPVIPQILEIRAELAELGIEPSVRRLDKGAGLIRASAYLGGRTRATEEDLSPLAHVLWEETEQIPKVRERVLSRANEFLLKAQDLADEAEEAARDAMNADDVDATAKGRDANQALRGIQNRLLDLRTRAETAGRATQALDAALERVKTLNREVVSRCLGIDGL